MTAPTGEELARRCADVMWKSDTASQHLAMELREVSVGYSVMSMRVQEFMANGWGMCHGGYVSALADSAFAFACNSRGEVTVAAGFDITFLRSAEVGDELIATATEKSVHGRSGLYDVTVIRWHEDELQTIAEMRGRSRSLGTSIL